MWRMFKAGILGVFLGVVFGVIFGHMSYVKNYSGKAAREIMADAVMFNNTQDDSDRVIRLKVNYDGDLGSEDKKKQLESYVGNTVMEQVQKWLGDDYSNNMSYIEMRHNLVMAMDEINEIAGYAADKWGVDADADSGFSYEYFRSAGDELPPGYYETLSINLDDK